MKLPFSICVLCIAFTSLHAGPHEHVKRGNWHLSLTGGLVFPTSSDSDLTGDDGSALASEIDWDNGPAVMIAGGYTWNQIRFELEYSFRKTDMLNDSFKNRAGLSNTKNEVTYHSAMINISYDWFLFDKFFWYNGLGAGLSLPQLHSRESFDDATMAIAYQFITGIGYQVTERIDIYWGYRMFRTTDVEFTNEHQGVKYELDFDVPWINQFEAGVRMRF